MPAFSGSYPQTRANAYPETYGHQAPPSGSGYAEIDAIADLEAAGMYVATGYADVDCVADIEAVGLFVESGYAEIDAVADIDAVGLLRASGYAEIDAVADIQLPGSGLDFGIDLDAELVMTVDLGVALDMEA